MLVLDVILDEKFSDELEKFVQNTFQLELEHSLASMSKWESFFEKPFLGKDEKTLEETLWYVKAMVLTKDVPPEVFDKLSSENFQTIYEYISSKRTATTFPDGGEKKPNREVITSEIVYYWMIVHNINFECQHWHLNRLLTLIQVCNVKNAPAKKMSKAEAVAQHKKLNAERRARYGSSG